MVDALDGVKELGDLPILLAQGLAVLELDRQLDKELIQPARLHRDPGILRPSASHAEDFVHALLGQYLVNAHIDLWVHA